MDHEANRIFFALLRSAICQTSLTEEERKGYCPEWLPDLLRQGSQHDVAHLLVLGLKKNAWIPEGDRALEKLLFKTVYRHERLRQEYENLCHALENAQIPFMPLKGAVICRYYPETWMRTSCDIDVLVHREDLERAVECLTDQLQYVKKERTTHDVSLFSSTGVHVELHFDLVEEGRANQSIQVLSSVWKHAEPYDGYKYFYEMSREFFYFYHVAHMAKHFENGGCGVRPLIDLWILDSLKDMDLSACDDLLSRGGLLTFAQQSRILSQVWFGGRKPNALSCQMQDFILHGGVYGSTDNRVALQQGKKGGRVGYLLSRIFIPYEKLKRYYPILEKHKWLTPLMQVRRWLMLLNSNVRSMARREISAGGSLSDERVKGVQDLLEQIGL